MVVERCVNTTENGSMCKSEEEINEYLRDKYLLLYYNERHFNTSDYFANSVVEQSR